MASYPLHIPIDRFGRVVLPKPLRDRLGVSAGMEFELEEQEDAIVLRPIRPKLDLVEEEGWLVVAESPHQPTLAETNQALAEDREERMKKIYEGSV